MIHITPYRMASRFIGIKEVPGAGSNPQVLAFLRLDNSWPSGDSVPWCSAFVNYVCWLLGVERSGSLSARSWLRVGDPIPLEQAEADSDIVILQRGIGEQPGPDVIAAPGHVGFYAGHNNGLIDILSGNQGDAVSIQAFSVAHILGVRRLRELDTSGAFRGDTG